MDPTQVVLFLSLIGLSYVRCQTTGDHSRWAPHGTSSTGWNPSPTSSSGGGSSWSGGSANPFSALGGGGMGGMSGMNMAAMARMSETRCRKFRTMKSTMMNPSSQMMALAKMQSRLGDNFVFNPSPPEVVYNACPYFTTLQQCTVNPCPLRCKRYPAAKCVTNPCGGCSPEWYSGGQRILDCD